ncbi:MAG: hypothetical protein ABWK01_07930 [Infirmifilum sp.]
MSEAQSGWLQLVLAWFVGFAAGVGAAWVLSRRKRISIIYAPPVELAPAGYEQVDIYAGRWGG